MKLPRRSGDLVAAVGDAASRRELLGVDLPDDTLGGLLPLPLREVREAAATCSRPWRRRTARAISALQVMVTSSISSFAMGNPGRFDDARREHILSQVLGTSPLEFPANVVQSTRSWRSTRPLGFCHELVVGTGLLEAAVPVPPPRGPSRPSRLGDVHR